MKERSIQTVSNNLQAAKTSLNVFRDTHWRPWFNNKNQSEFYGFNKKNQKVLFHYSERSYNTTIIDSLGSDHAALEYLKTTPDEELPIIMNESVWNKNYPDLLEQRLKHKIKPTPLNQELLDEFLYLQCRIDHMYKLIYLYEKLLTKMVLDLYRHNVYNKYQQHFTLILTIQGIKYHFSNIGKEFKLIDGEIKYDQIN